MENEIFVHADGYFFTERYGRGGYNTRRLELYWDDEDNVLSVKPDGPWRDRYGNAKYE